MLINSWLTMTDYRPISWLIYSRNIVAHFMDVIYGNSILINAANPGI